MTRNPLIPLFLLASATFATTAATAGEAHAGGYVEGTAQIVKTSCPVTGYADQTKSYVGYYADPSTGLPQTGDVAYVHAVVVNIGCVNDGASVELFLPAGVTQATQYPVMCKRGNANLIEDVPYTSSSFCLQTPQAGQNNGWLYGQSALPPGWFMEVLVPVTYSQELLGNAGPTSHRLTAAVMSTWGTMFPFVPVTAGYRAQLVSPTSSGVTALTANLALELRSYFKSGSFYIDFGTTAALGQSTPAAAVSAQYASYPITSQLQQLVPSTTYHWRARFVTSTGLTFTSATQTFTTLAAPPVALTVGIAGRGTGRVTSSPAGIDCGEGSTNQCTAIVPQGTMVTLEATPSLRGYVFTGWSGACSGYAVCTVPVWQATSVTANFDFYYFVATRLPGPIPPPRR